jgi:Icc-related predicted phosphoesterase
MRIQIFSDLHTDVAPAKPISIAEDVDAVAVGGDTCQGAKNAFVALRRIVPEHVPLILTIGNHEGYGRCLGDEIAEAKSAASDFNIHFLENDTAIIGGTRFVGACLWTDYRIFGERNAAAAMDAARRELNDHRRISWRKTPWQRFRPQEALLLHTASRAFIADTLATAFAGATVVLTHHAPHFNSVAERYRSDILTAAYASDLTDVIETGRPDLWLHGHIHTSSDYRVGETRIIANPHGYGPENAAFNPSLVVEVGS